MIKSMRIEGMLLCMLVVCATHLTGCQQTLTSEGQPLTWTREDLDTLHRRSFPYLFNRVQIHPSAPAYHAKELAEANDPNVAAYHIIAIGVLGENVPAIRTSLVGAIPRFEDQPWPKGYDWPDVAAAFEDYVLHSQGPLTISPYPCNRNWVSMKDLIWECYERIGSPQDVHNALVRTSDSMK